MGWKAWDVYDREAQKRWRALPWNERYSWRTIGGIVLLAIIAAAVWYAVR